MNNRWFHLIFLFILLTGCMSQSPEKNIYFILENVVELEKPFKEQQKPISELEKKESEIYNQIVSLNTNEFEKIKQLSEEALSVLNELEDRMNKEYKSIVQSRNEFSKIGDEISKINDEPLKTQAFQLQKTMEKRYDIYESLYSHYIKALEYNKKLYEMFQQENLSLNEIEAQIQLINDAYKQVKETTKSFNEQTKQYNEAKLKFFEDAGLNIEKQSKSTALLR